MLAGFLLPLSLSSCRFWHWNLGNFGNPHLAWPEIQSTTTLFPFVMLSEVGAHATTQSKHPEAASSNNTDAGNSTETAGTDIPDSLASPKASLSRVPLMRPRFLQRPNRNEVSCVLTCCVSRRKCPRGSRKLTIPARQGMGFRLEAEECFSKRNRYLRSQRGLAASVTPLYLALAAPVADATSHTLLRCAPRWDEHQSSVPPDLPQPFRSGCRIVIHAMGIARCSR